MRLFISYAHVDRPQIQLLVDVLRDGGHDPWFDHRLKVGTDWKAELLKAIQEADRFVYVLTPESVDSEWCQWEFARAVEIGKPIIPVLWQANTKLPKALENYQYADFTEGITVRAVARLMDGLFSAVTVTIPQTQAPTAPAEPAGLPSRAEPNGKANNHNNRWNRRAFAAFGLVVGLFVIAGFFVVPPLLPGTSTQTPTNSALPTTAIAQAAPPTATHTALPTATNTNTASPTATPLSPTPTATPFPSLPSATLASVKLSTQIYKGHQDGVNSAALSADKKWLVTGSDDKTARVWDAVTNTLKFTLPHESFVYQVAISPDGKYFLTGSNPNAGRLWDLQTGQELFKQTFQRSVWAVGFSADSQYFAMSSTDKTYVICTVKSPRKCVSGTLDGESMALAFAPKELLLWIGNGKNVSAIRFDAVLDAPPTLDTRMLQGHQKNVRAIAVSPDGTLIVTGSDDKQALLWNADTFTARYPLATLQQAVRSIAIAPSGKCVLIGGEDRVARRVTISPARELVLANYGGSVNSVSFIPNQPDLALLGIGDYTARVIQIPGCE